ncbi:MAG: transposase [Chloroflexota bacterium]|nr:transposase [Chloroflexota bacterium]
METYAWEGLRHFRQELYGDLGLRQDSLFELLDAVLTTPQRSTLVRLSLSTAFRRRWPSTCDALADGSIDVPALRELFARELPESATIDARPLWVIDGTNWPRPAARASADRTWEYRPLPGWPQNGIVPAWAYQWLVAVPDVAGSWVLPLDVQRRGPTAKSATQVALDQIAKVREAQGAGAPRPIVTLDSGYDLETLAHAKVDADLLVRLIRSRVVYRVPEQHPGRGRPRLHGEPFRLADDRIHWPATAVDPTDSRGLWRGSIDAGPISTSVARRMLPSAWSVSGSSARPTRSCRLGPCG